jgi:hypothetical protein
VLRLESARFAIETNAELDVTNHPNGLFADVDAEGG